MTGKGRSIVAAAMALAACSQAPGPIADEQAKATRLAESIATEPAAAEGAGVGMDPTGQPPSVEQLAAADLVLAEWRKAENRITCAPLTFADSDTVEGAPRRANFAGGWAVAWDRPGLRSAFGVAGTGFVPGQSDDFKAQRARLAAQWPYFREIDRLQPPAFAGYGVEGGEAFPADNSNGDGMDSLAYVRVGGQSCDYNVWSKLGRAHLEALLESLRPVPR